MLANAAVPTWSSLRAPPRQRGNATRLGLPLRELLRLVRRALPRAPLELLCAFRSTGSNTRKNNADSCDAIRPGPPDQDGHVMIMASRLVGPKSLTKCDASYRSDLVESSVASPRQTT